MDSLKKFLQSKATQQAMDEAKELASEAGDAVLDDLEKALLGEAAGQEDPEAYMKQKREERLKELEAAGEARRKERADRADRAREELAALKAQLAQDEDDA